jgi:hypothetical protein
MTHHNQIKELTTWFLRAGSSTLLPLDDSHVTHLHTTCYIYKNLIRKCIAVYNTPATLGLAVVILDSPLGS